MQIGAFYADIYKEYLFFFNARKVLLMEDFNQQIIPAAADKERWFDTTALPKIQEAYRLHLSCVRNLFDALVKRSLITPDPYKNDKKISDITRIEDTEFNDNEKSIILGKRLSDYESLIDFVCNYMRFSISQLGMEKIRKLLELNNTFAWNALSENSAKPNTKALAAVLTSLKTGATPLTLSLIKDSVAKTVTAFSEINATLKQLTEFQKERYKIDVRKNVLGSEQFNKEAAYSSTTAFITETKRLFAPLMPKRSFVADLIGEIAAEETAPDKEARQKKLLDMMTVSENKVQKKVEKVNTHDILMEAVRVMGTLSESYDLIFEKICINHDVLESEHNTLGDKFMRFIRKLFGIAEPPVDYEVILTDKKTEAKRREVIHFKEFKESLMKRARYYASFSVRHTPGFNRISSQPDETILDFLNKHIIENNHLLALLGALDEFFKDTVHQSDRSRIKGIKMELTTLKNIMVKVNQHRVEYTSYIEEQNQMRKLGIIEGE